MVMYPAESIKAHWLSSFQELYVWFYVITSHKIFILSVFPQKASLDFSTLLIITISKDKKDDPYDQVTQAENALFEFTKTYHPENLKSKMQWPLTF